MPSSSLRFAFAPALSLCALAAPAGWAQTAPPPGGSPPKMPSVAAATYDPAIGVTAGRLLPTRNADASVSGGAVTAASASGVTVRSTRRDVNALLVRGPGPTYTLADATIEVGGGGSDDFVGLGAGAMTAGASLVLRNVTITARGTIAPATVATDRGVLRVYDSRLIAHGGPIPADYRPHIGAGMMEPPKQLLITGTARTHVTLNNAEAYFYRTRIEADGWGGLSTDMAGKDLYLEANDCDIVVRNSGYGTYADFGATCSSTIRG